MRFSKLPRETLVLLVGKNSALFKVTEKKIEKNLSISAGKNYLLLKVTEKSSEKT